MQPMARWLVPAFIAVLVAACGGDGSPAPTTDPTVTIAPAQAELAPGGTQAFASTVTGASGDVVWSVAEGTAGGTVTAGGLYTAPGTPGTYHVRAALTMRPEVGAIATVVVAAEGEPPRIAIVPAQARVSAGGVQTFRAEVTGLADLGVNWSIAEGSSGGTIDEAGRYTAPLAAGTYHVVAASVANGTLRTEAVVTVQAVEPAVLTVTPATATVQIGSAVEFDANEAVRWSVQEEGGGTVDETGRYTAPLATGTYHVLATSVAQPSRTATAEVTVTEAGENLVDYGGPVMPTARVYAIWWGDQAALADSKVALEAFIRDLQGSRYLAIADQYLRGGKAHVELGGRYEDSSIPALAYSGDVANKACEILSAPGEGIDPDGIYFVFTSFLIKGAGGAGWHGYFVCNGATYRLVWVSHSDQFIDFCQGSPGSGAAAVGVFSHELFESITDGGPGTAWLGLDNREIADKCPRECHAVGSRSWYSNALWSNETGACEPEALPWMY